MFFSPYLHADTFYGSAHISHKKEKDLTIMGDGSIKNSNITNLASMGNLTLTSSNIENLKNKGSTHIKSSKIDHLEGQGSTLIKSSNIQEAKTSGDTKIDTSSIQRTLKAEGYIHVSKSSVQDAEYKGSKIEIDGSHIHKLVIKKNNSQPIEVILSNHSRIDILILEDPHTKIIQDKTSKIDVKQMAN